ncbi:MAG: hybrid sensor histidine kinase/response regulator [Planctomycetes bacterium]|nr:hybrid sensor histidine kinase/response regulator [Planctomycetota bacterium]
MNNSTQMPELQPDTPILTVSIIGGDQEEKTLFESLLKASKSQSETLVIQKPATVGELTDLESRSHLLLLHLGTTSDLELKDLSIIKERLPTIPIIVVADLNDDTLGQKAISLGAQDYLFKEAINIYSLSRAVRYAIARNNIQIDLDNALSVMEEFSHTAAHDLRNPIGTIQSFADLLLSQDLEVNPEESKHMIKKIYACSERMIQLIDDLLLYSTSNISVDMTDVVSVSDLISEVCEQLNCDSKVSLTGSASLVGNKSLLYQLFQNLTANALKFQKNAEQAKVTVSINTEEIIEGYTAISVADNGVGIPEGKLNQIFTPFTRVHSGYAGTGIGLATCQRIVDLHGGDINVSNRTEGGTEFIVRLPISSEK